MDDMNAFERQVEAELGQMAGPGRRIDGLAMVRSVATDSSGSRLRSMLTATRFVLAAAIVAVFGGMLLAGFMAQPEGDPLPAGGASPSASGEPEPSAESSASELLPGVDLRTEEVAPGVHRVLSDGIRDASADIWHVAADAEGGVWLERHVVADGGRTADSRVFRLGQPEEYVLSRYPDLETEDQEVRPSVTTDGIVLVGDPDTSQGALTFDGDAWVPAEGCLDVAHWGSFTGPDGSCWFTPPTPEVVRRLPGTSPDDDGSIAYGLDELDMVAPAFGLSGWEGWPLMQLAMTGDGTIWASGDMPGTPDAQFSAFDGESWTRIPAMAPIDGVASSMNGVHLALAGGPGASLWVSRWDRVESELYAWHWDGADWATYGPIETNPVAAAPNAGWPIPWTGLHVDDDFVWLDGLVRFDGEHFEVFDVPTTAPSVTPRVNSVTHGPHGSLWLTVIDEAASDPTTDGLFVITPEARAATSTAATDGSASSTASSTEDDMVQVQPLATAVVTAAMLASAAPAAAQDPVEFMEVGGVGPVLADGCVTADYEGTHEDIGVDAQRFICSTDTGMPWSFRDPRLEGTVTRINEESHLELGDGPDVWVASTHRERRGSMDRATAYLAPAGWAPDLRLAS